MPKQAPGAAPGSSATWLLLMDMHAKNLGLVAGTGRASCRRPTNPRPLRELPSPKGAYPLPAFPGESVRRRKSRKVGATTRRPAIADSEEHQPRSCLVPSPSMPGTGGGPLRRLPRFRPDQRQPLRNRHELAARRYPSGAEPSLE